MSEKTPFLTPEAQAAMQHHVSENPSMAEWSVPTHYANVDGNTLQVPEAASSLPVGELTDQVPEGVVRPIRMPNTAGQLQTWFKEGVGKDVHGEERVALVSYDGDHTVGATMPTAEYAKARQAARLRLGKLATGLPAPQPAAPEKPHEPYVPSELEMARPRPKVIRAQKP